MSNLVTQRSQARGLEQSRVIERPGAVTGFDTFYATGTWTPTLVGSAVAGTFTYDGANTFGTYSRIGNRVFLTGRVRITAIAVAPTGNLAIGGLPITSNAISIAGGILIIGYQGITLTAGHTQLHAYIGSAATILNLFESGSNIAFAAIQGAGLVLVAGVADIIFEGQYTVA